MCTCIYIHMHTCIYTYICIVYLFNKYQEIHFTLQDIYTVPDKNLIQNHNANSCVSFF